MHNMNYDEIGPAEKYKYDYAQASVGENPQHIAEILILRYILQSYRPVVTTEIHCY